MAIVRIPAGSLVLPVGDPRSVLGRLAAVDRGALGPSALAPVVSARLRSGLTAVAAADHTDLTAVAAAIGLAAAVGAPVVAVCAAGAAATRDALEAAGVDVVAGPADRLVVIGDGWDQRHLPGAKVVIGDVHNCWRTLMGLLARLGFDDDGNHPDGLLPVFVGDLVDKGGTDDDDAVRALELVRSWHRRGRCLVVEGNHERAIARKLAAGRADGRWGAARTLAAIRRRPESYAADLVRWIGRLPTHLVFDGGDLVVAHAAVRPELIGTTDRKGMRRLEAACLWGIRPPKGEPQEDAAGLPVRVDWARTYRGSARVVHGHVVVDAPRVLNRVVNVDTGCYAGGGLSAYLVDEDRFVREPTHPDDLAPDGARAATAA